MYFERDRGREGERKRESESGHLVQYGHYHRNSRWRELLMRRSDRQVKGQTEDLSTAVTVSVGPARLRRQLAVKHWAVL